MASSNSPFRRVGPNSWQEVLDAVNDKLENPPQGCDPIEPIESPGPDHIWSQADIQEVHAKLQEMPTDCFQFQEIPDLWKLETINDILDQLDESWCDCECDATEDSGKEVIFLSFAEEVISDCFNNTDTSAPLCDFIDGFLLAPSGVVGRSWSVFQRRFEHGVLANTRFVASGEVSCFGDVICTITGHITTRAGCSVSQIGGGSCDDEVFQLAVAACQSQIDERQHTYEYFIRLDTPISAKCEECE